MYTPIFICIPEQNFRCPFCSKLYTDEKDRYYRRIEAAKKGYIKVKCDCGNTFGVAHDMTGDKVAFKFP